MKTALPAKKNLKNDANEQCDVKKEEDETEKLEDNTDPDYSDGEVEDDESADSGELPILLYSFGFFGFSNAKHFSFYRLGRE